MDAEEYAKNAARSTTRVGLAGLIRTRMDQIIALEGAIERSADVGGCSWVMARAAHIEKLSALHAEFLKGGV